MSGIIFSDTFFIEGIDWDPVKKVVQKKFDKVSRIDAKSESYDTNITIDINTEIYPMSKDTKFEVLLADRLQDELANESEEAGYDPTLELDLRGSAFDYIMAGKVFKYAEEKSRAVVYASFGGLLMALKGETKILTPNSFKVDSRVYLFIRKV